MDPSFFLTWFSVIVVELAAIPNKVSENVGTVFITVAAEVLIGFYITKFVRIGSL